MVTSLFSGTLASISNTMRCRAASEYTNSPETSALPGTLLRMPTRLGTYLRLLLLCTFSRDAYLFFMVARITGFSKSLLWM